MVRMEKRETHSKIDRPSEKRHRPVVGGGKGYSIRCCGAEVVIKGMKSQSSCTPLVTKKGMENSVLRGVKIVGIWEVGF